MGEGSNELVNVYISKDGQKVLLGKAKSIEFTKEAAYPMKGIGEKGEKAELASYLNSSPLTIDLELTQYNLDFFLTIGTPLMREEDYHFILGTQFKNEFSWDYGGADDLIEFLSLLLRGESHKHGTVFLFYWALGNYYELKVELLNGANYHAYDGLNSITLDGYAVTPTAPMLFKVVNFLCMYKANTELVLDGARVKLKVCKIESKEEDN